MVTDSFNLLLLFSLLYHFFIGLQDLESFLQLVLFPLFRVMILCSVIVHEDVDEIHAIVHFFVFQLVFELHVQNSFLHLAGHSLESKKYYGCVIKVS